MYKMGKPHISHHRCLKSLFNKHAHRQLAINTFYFKIKIKMDQNKTKNDFFSEYLMRNAYMCLALNNTYVSMLTVSMFFFKLLLFLFLSLLIKCFLWFFLCSTCSYIFLIFPLHCCVYYLWISPDFFFNPFFLSLTLSVSFSFSRISSELFFYSLFYIRFIVSSLIEFKHPNFIVSCKFILYSRKRILILWIRFHSNLKQTYNIYSIQFVRKSTYNLFYTNETKKIELWILFLLYVGIQFKILKQIITLFFLALLQIKTLIWQFIMVNILSMYKNCSIDFPCVFLFISPTQM